MIEKLLKHLYLRSSLFYVNRGNLALARKHFDVALSMTPNKSDFMNAYHARLLMLEGRHEAARDRLREVIESGLDSENVNAAYIEKFCSFILALYKQDAKARTMKSEAMKLAAEKKYRRFLPFLSDQSIDSILEY